MFKIVIWIKLYAARPVEKHEENISVLSPDIHSNLESQKSAGSSKTTRKTKEKTTDKTEKAPKEKPVTVVRPEPQVRINYCKL